MAETVANDEKVEKDVHPAYRKYVTIVFRGSLTPPENTSACVRNSNEEKETYLADIKEIQDYMKLNEHLYYLYKICNVDQANAMQCADVLKEIENASKFAKDNNGAMLRIYYTGCGQLNTGNWCFVDGVVSFDQIVNTLKTYWKDSSWSVLADCSFSGNWALELFKYDKILNNVYVRCASYPFKEAQSHKQGRGGLFTLWWVEELTRDNTKLLRDCQAKIEDNMYSLKYFHPKNNDQRFI
eukprot:95065_1